MASTSAPIDLGDLVVCKDDKLAEPFGVTGRVGIIAESRKRDARAVYLDPERSLWIPHTSLRAAGKDEREASPLAVASDLFRKLGGKELEVHPAPGGRLRIILAHGAVTPELLDAIRAELGGRLTGWRLRPAGLSKIQSLIEVAATTG